MKSKNYLELYLTDIIFKHYFDFKGREGRKVFWLYTLNTFIIYALLVVMSLNFLGVLISLLIFLPSLGLSVRRLHDVNFSGWWVLINLIPLLGYIVLIVIMCLPGTEGENKYGPVVVDTVAVEE